MRLAALDPVAGDALSVIAYFDRLTEGHAGLSSVVRGAAVLSGSPARFVDAQHRVSARVLPDGTVAPASSQPDPRWVRAPVRHDAESFIWLERSGVPGPVEAMIIERAAVALRTVLDRTRGHTAASVDDQALLECVLDAAAPEGDRLMAARRLGLPHRLPVRALALPGGSARITRGATFAPDVAGLRAGVGPAGSVAELPTSWAGARLALRLTAEGTGDDPGPRLVHADRMGGLAVLARTVTRDTPPEADVTALERAAATMPGLLATLAAIAEAPSQRAAAAVRHVHHSTLQDHLDAAERLLGWELQNPEGRLRLQLALALRRLHRYWALGNDRRTTTALDCSTPEVGPDQD